MCQQEDSSWLLANKRRLVGLRYTGVGWSPEVEFLREEVYMPSDGCVKNRGRHISDRNGSYA